MREFVLPESVLFTDERGGYNEVGLDHQGHRRVHHSERVYVSGDVHTNAVEG